MSQQALRIYLNDHLAGATFGRALVRRAASENPDGELGLFLTGLRREIEDDLETLQRVMRCVRAPANPAKRLAAALAERAGRLKLNGSLRDYSDLSRLVELDGLATGTMGKQALWRALTNSTTTDLRALTSLGSPTGPSNSTTTLNDTGGSSRRAHSGRRRGR